MVSGCPHANDQFSNYASTSPVSPYSPLGITLLAVTNTDQLTILDKLKNQGDHMKSATVSKLKATLSEYLARVKAGEEVLVTERGKPIAKIIPLAPVNSTTSPHLLELARSGLVRIGTGSLPKGFWARPRPKDPRGAALRALLEERAEGR